MLHRELARKRGPFTGICAGGVALSLLLGCAGADGASDSALASEGLAAAEQNAEARAGETRENENVAEAQHAGVVIRFDDGTYCTQCVALRAGEASISGEELLTRASRLFVELTNFGSDTNPDRALCRVSAPVNQRIESRGCSADDCFCDGNYYWSYFRQTPAGWDYQTTGPTKSRVRAGEVDGWSWTEYPDDTAPPTITLREMCSQTSLTECAYRVFLPSVRR